MIDSVSAVNEQLLGDGLERLGAAIPGCVELVDVFDGFVRTASDDELVRINPVRFAQQRELPTVAVVDLFLYARKLGLLTMEWQYVCPGCGEIVERLASLTGIGGCRRELPGASCGISAGCGVAQSANGAGCARDAIVALVRITEVGASEREVDRLLTMRSERQPVATSGNGFGLFQPFAGPLHLPPVATGCAR
jgi:hypothetical protein